MIKGYFFALCGLLCTFSLFAQNVGINADGSTPNTSAGLDIKFTDKGLLIPRVAINDVNSASPITTPAEGLLVYNETGTEAKGFYYWNGTKWSLLQTGNSPGNAWNTTGNAGTVDDGTNFIGTTDNVPLNFKINNEKAGRIGVTGDGSVFFGYQAGNSDDKSSNQNVGIGYRALFANTTGSHNVANGYGALFANTTGSNNIANGNGALLSNRRGSGAVAIGTEAMYYANSTTTAFDNGNIAIGYQALRGSTTAANNTGNYNTVIGREAMVNNTSGSNNTANGYQVLSSNTTGSYNTANGYQTLPNNTTGNSNIANGYRALFANTTGNSNIANGYGALYFNQTGSGAVAIGAEAMYYANNTTTAFNNGNIAIGYRALLGSTNPANNTGNFNTVIGREAMMNNTTGSNNIANGYQALFSNTTGSYNTGLGYNAQTGATLTNATAIGANAEATTSNSVVIGSINGTNGATADANVGIGTTAPTQRLHVVGSILMNDGNQGAGKVLTSNANGVASWQDLPVASGNNWSLTGNAGTVDNGTNFIGTTDNVPLNFKVNNVKAGRIGVTGDQSTFFGYQAGNSDDKSDNRNVGIGYQALYSNTTGNYNIANGYRALYFNTTGADNIANGYQALYSNTTGNNNVAYGSFALANNTTGSYNIANGYQALKVNTTGYDNIANGIQALYSNTTGDGNVANGIQALYFNTTGDGNVANGYQALFFNTGSYNTGLGYNTQTGMTLTNATAIGANASATTSNSVVIGSINGTNGATATVNVGIGTTAPTARLHVVGSILMNDGNQGAGKVLTSDANGVASWQNLPFASGNNWALAGNAGTVDDGTNFIGTTDNVSLNFKTNNEKAGRIGVTGDQSTFFGYQAGNSDDKSANNNVGIGYQALYNNTTGANNSANGHTALHNNTTGNGNTAHGYRALHSNTAGSGAVAIGTFSMYYANNTATAFENGNVAIGYDALRGSTTAANNTGNYNTVIGREVMRVNTTGSNNTANGYQALNVNTTGNDNTAIGYQALNVNTTGNNNTAIGYNAQVPTANADNQVRIGNTSVTYAGVQVAWTVTSDRRWKTNIQESPLGLSFIQSLRPVAYVRNSDKQQQPEYGFIAQEVEQALQNAGVNPNGVITKDDEGMYGVRYNDFIAPMVKSIQELSEENEQLKTESKQLKEKNKELERRLERLEKLLGK